VLIVDAGGGTIDISSYSVLNGAPLQVEELFRPKCQFARILLSGRPLKHSCKAYCKAENLLQREQGKWSKVVSCIAAVALTTNRN